MAFSSVQMTYGCNTMLKLLIISFFQITICESAASSLSASHTSTEDVNGIHMRSVNPTKTSTQQVRLHHGVIAAVIFVSFAATIAAFFIIRKYCFPRSEVTYRYSVLRRLEDQGPGDSEPYTEGEESDEDLLE